MINIYFIISILLKIYVNAKAKHWRKQLANIRTHKCDAADMKCRGTSN